MLFRVASSPSRLLPVYLLLSSLYSLSSVVAIPSSTRRPFTEGSELDPQIRVGRINPDLVTWIKPGRGFVQGEKLVLELEKLETFMFITEAESLKLNWKPKWEISYWEGKEGEKRGIVTSRDSRQLRGSRNCLESLEAKVQFSIDGPGKPKGSLPLALTRAVRAGLTNVTYLEQETGIKPNSDVDYISAGLRLIIKLGYIPKEEESEKLLETWDAYKARIGSIRQAGEVKD
ncbi:hypothetical protein F5050DRAFT_1498885 [Lentinula boryana]|uniref:Uncharacterized protein n=1 Tax=Lentinula boryana TaxID=40481 RepID=A0ABQ8QEK9_9AGAR|nr:hypothetical protein F5050DRAFT_1498885 [Lentinula boryana]